MAIKHLFGVLAGSLCPLGTQLFKGTHTILFLAIFSIKADFSSLKKDF